MISAVTRRSPSASPSRAKASTASTSAGMSPRGRPRKPRSRARAAQLVDHRLGLRAVQRQQAQRGVAEQFRRDAAHAEQDRGAEMRVALQAEDHLDAAGDQFLHQQAVRRTAGGGGDAGEHRGTFGFHARSAGTPTQDAADIALVRDVARQRLEHDALPEVARGPRRLGRRGAGDLAHRRDAEAREERLAFSFVHRPGAKRGQRRQRDGRRCRARRRWRGQGRRASRRRLPARSPRGMPWRCNAAPMAGACGLR